MKFEDLRVGFWKFNSSVCGFFLFALECLPEEERAEGEDAGAEFEKLAAAFRPNTCASRALESIQSALSETRHINRTYFIHFALETNCILLHAKTGVKI